MSWSDLALLAKYMDTHRQFDSCFKLLSVYLHTIQKTIYKKVFAALILALNNSTLQFRVWHFLSFFLFSHAKSGKLFKNYIPNFTYPYSNCFTYQWLSNNKKDYSYLSCLIFILMNQNKVFLLKNHIKNPLHSPQQ